VPDTAAAHKPTNAAVPATYSFWWLDFMPRIARNRSKARLAKHEVA
jgi:hypothetical protein